MYQMSSRVKTWYLYMWKDYMQKDRHNYGQKLNCAFLCKWNGLVFFLVFIYM